MGFTGVDTVGTSGANEEGTVDGVENGGWDENEGVRGVVVVCWENGDDWNVGVWVEKALGWEMPPCVEKGIFGWEKGGCVKDC